MNTVRCSNCSAENAAELSFCTNCGTSLPSSNFGQASQSNAANSIPVTKSKSGRNAAIIGGLGCLVILIGAVALCGILGYIGRNTSNNNSANNTIIETSVSENNPSLTNRGTLKSSNSNSVIFGNSNSSSSNSNSSGAPTDEEFRNFLPPQVGDYEREGDAIDGNVTEDFPGADKIIKSDYLKKKKVKVVLAQFSSPAVAKQSYGYFRDGFKSAGAKILLRQKVKNKAGIETGELSIYTYKGVWETMVYVDRFGFRITAPDRVTLGEFLKSFGGYLELMGGE
ncbi:MAG: zinc ribbon domain-containing protein [Pyrinomonadaceae bacterium]